MVVFVNGPKHGWKIPDPKTSIFYIPRVDDVGLMEGRVTLRPPAIVRGTYERKYNKDTGVPGYIWAGWEDEQ